MEKGSTSARVRISDRIIVIQQKGREVGSEHEYLRT